MENYRVVKTDEDGIPGWAVERRSFLFFFRPLKISKILMYNLGEGPNNGRLSVKREVPLVFRSESNAHAELNYLNNGGEAIKARVFKNGVLVATTRKLNVDLVVGIIDTRLWREK